MDCAAVSGSGGRDGGVGIKPIQIIVDARVGRYRGRFEGRTLFRPGQRKAFGHDGPRRPYPAGASSSGVLGIQFVTTQRPTTINREFTDGSVVELADTIAHVVARSFLKLCCQCVGE